MKLVGYGDDGVQRLVDESELAGTQGQDGAKGDQGDQGVPGPIGMPGPAGAPGPAYDPTNLLAQLKAMDERLKAAEYSIANYPGNANPQSYGIDLATIGGANDEERKDNAIALAKTSGRPMVLPFNRAFTPTTGFTVWGAGGGGEGAFRLVGAFPFVGAQNLEQGSKKVLSWIDPGSGVGMDDKALFVNPGTTFDGYIGRFAVQGEGGGGIKGVNGNGGGGQQFWYGPYSAGRNAYRWTFDTIAMNFMASGWGTADLPAAVTACNWWGVMEYLNCWPGRGGWWNLGGSDCMANVHLNAGPSGNPVQAGRIVNGLREDWLINITNLSKSKLGGEYFLTHNNEWGGLRIKGSKNICYDLKVTGVQAEGYKPTGTQASGPGSGTCVRVEGGTGKLTDFGIGQSMAWPLATEHTAFEVLGGDWAVDGTTFYTGTSDNAQHQLYVGAGAKVTESNTTYRER